MLDSSSSDMQQNGSFVPKRRRVDDDVYGELILFFRCFIQTFI